MRKFHVKRRLPAAKPALSWIDLEVGWNLNAQATTTNVSLFAMQAPSNPTNLTSDPPEDITILRVVGDFSVELSAAVGNWSLALIVADVTWTPSPTIAADNDKRLLWQRTYSNAAGTAVRLWYYDLFQDGTAVFPMGTRELTHIDIKPKVKLEPGKALYLVAYENGGTATLTTDTVTMRCLYQKSRRR